MASSACGVRVADLRERRWLKTHGGWVLEGVLLSTVETAGRRIELYGRRTVRQEPYFQPWPHVWIGEKTFTMSHEFFLLHRRGGAPSVIARSWTVPDPQASGGHPIVARGRLECQVPVSAGVTQKSGDRHMGLDGVEFIMAVEEAFQIAIPDEDAQRMLTPRDVATYVFNRVGSEDGHGCVEQRAFYRLRRASMKVFGQPRNAVRPATRWDDVLPKRQRRHNWRLLHKATGTPHWPRLTVLGNVPDAVATVGETARYLVAHGETVFQQPGEGWSLQGIEATITRLMRDQLRITEFRWDQEFVRDLGVD